MLLKNLDEIVTKYALLKAQIKALEEEAKTHGINLIETLFDRGAAEHAIAAGKLAIANRSTKVLKPELLIAAGVGIDKIQAATVTSVSAPFLVWTPRKADADA